MCEKIALITGGTSGYGKATAKMFAESGAKVIIAARNKEKLEQVRKEIHCDAAFAMDVTSVSDWDAVKQFVVDTYGRLDILVNNAGGGVAIKETAEQKTEDIDKTIALNLTSVIYGAKTFAPLMKDRKEGTIINVSSVCAKHAWPGWSVYAAAKAGVLSFSKGLYVELQPYNIRVSCVIPAAASTGFQKNAGLDTVDAKLGVDDIARTILHICSLPQRAVVEEVTVWGIDQIVNPF